jgi:S1-C subfamily serine protease
MTAGHVILDDDDDEHTVETSVWIGMHGGSEYPVELVKKEKTPDIAIFVLPYVLIGDFKSLRFGDSRKVPMGAKLVAVGFPSNAKSWSISEGLLSNPHGEGGNWQVSIALNPGESGGPVFNSEGQVVGIVAGGKDYLNGVAFAVPGAHTDPYRSIAMADDARIMAERAVMAAARAQMAAKVASKELGGWEISGDRTTTNAATRDAVDAAINRASSPGETAAANNEAAPPDAM